MKTFNFYVYSMLMDWECIQQLHYPSQSCRSTPWVTLRIASSLMSVLAVGQSYGAGNVLSYTKRMMQNVLAFRDSSIIPLTEVL